MNSLTRILIHLTLFSLSLALAGQKVLVPEINGFEGRFIHYPVTEPAANSSTNAMYFDKKGFFWQGTFDGLYRFDGTKYLCFPLNKTDGTGLFGKIVTGYYEDDKGRFWITTLGALNCLDPETGMVKYYFPEPGNPESENNWLRKIYRDKAGRIWLMSNWDVFTFDMKTEKFTKYRFEGINTFWRSRAVQYFEESSGRIWVTTQQGLYKYSAIEDKFIRYTNDPENPSSVSNNKITNLIED
jgi:ligand-binding sensor domain-containing protein